MIESPSQLRARKQDLVEALRALERDRVDGAIDMGAYRAARERYELEAAAILERLDGFPSNDVPASPPSHRRLILAASAIAGLVLLVALGVLLSGALNQRGAGQGITGDLPGGPTPSAVSAAVRAGQRAVGRHPESAAAWMRLGNAYLDVSQNSQAIDSFRQAVKLAPGRPDTATLYALALSSAGRYTEALGVLKRVERSHPEYARAWLAEGLAASKRRTTLPRALTSLRRFLELDPRGPVARSVRQLIRGLKKVQAG